MEDIYCSAASKAEVIAERKRIAAEPTSNVLVSFDNGELVCVHISPEFAHKIGTTDVRKFAEVSAEMKVVDAYYETQDNLQYYCIDGRVWIDTPEKAAKLLKIANQ